jgi:ribosomal protein L40E
MVAVLKCQRCHALTPGSRLRYICGRLVCDHCGAENPQSRVHSVQTRDIFVSFTIGEQCFAQAMSLDLHQPLGPRVRVASPETLRRLLAYLGAMPEGLS